MANLQVGVAGNGTVTVGSGASVHSPSNNVLTLGSNGDERLRITSAGKIGIGTDMGGAPASSYPFGVYTTGTGYVYTETGGSGASAGLRAKAGTADYTIYTTQGTGQLAIYDNTSSATRFRIASDGKVAINDTSPEELLDLGESNQQNLKLGQRGYLGQGYSTGATILGHSVKAKTTGTTIAGMEVTESNSGGGAPSAIRLQNGNIEFHTAASGTSGATFNSERLRIDESGNLNIVGVCTANSYALATSGKAFPCYEFSSWYVSSIFDPGSADCFIENWAESNGPAYARLGTAPSYASGVWTPPSTGYWKMTAMIVYYHDTTVGDSGAHAIRVSTDSGSNYNNVSTTGFRIDTSTGANIKRTTVVCASFKVATANTFRMGVYGIGVNENQFRYMSGSQVDAGGCSLLIEKVAEIET